MALHRRLPAAITATALALVVFADGGYFATSWSWLSVGCFSVLLFSATRGVELSRTETAFLASIALLALWAGVSSAWSPATIALPVAGRELAYLGAAAVSLILTRRLGPPALAGAVVAAIGAADVYAIATRLFPGRLGVYDPVAVYRLAAPVGYWNALAIMNVLACFFSIALMLHASSQAARASSCALLVPFAVTTYFTYSRGAIGVFALALGAFIVLTPRRLLAVSVVAVGAIAPVIAVAVASNSTSLTRQNVPLEQAVRDGRRFAILLLALCAAAAVLGYAASVARDRVRLSLGARRRVSMAFVGAACLGLAFSLVAVGRPDRTLASAWNSFTSAPPPNPTNLNDRLLTFSSNGRIDLWRAAAKAFEARPVQGSGAGTYERYWLEHRTVPLKVKNAHSLYMETAAELGVVGLIMLLGIGALPVMAAVRARTTDYVAAAATAYLAFLLHAAVDWDWQFPAVVVPAFAAAAVCLRGEAVSTDRLRTLPRTLYVSCAAVGVVLSFIVLAGELASATANAAAARGDWKSSRESAEGAARWMPWSSEPPRLAGEADLAEGRIASASTQFRNALEHDSGNWSLWFDLARATDGGRQRAALRRAAELNPLSPEVARLRQEIAQEQVIQVVPK